MIEQPYPMKGVWDVHTHPAPDVVPRSQTIEEVYQDAMEAQMAGVVIKSHLGCTAVDCNAIRASRSSVVQLVSSITLNDSIGGIEAASVERSASLGSKVVWFPTYSSRAHINTWGIHPLYPLLNESGVSVVDEKGRLSDAAEEVLRVVAQLDLVVASGHIAPRESLILFERAREVGVQRMVLTHVSQEVTRASSEIQRECIRLGVWIEHCMMGATACCPGSIAFEQLCREIRESGVEQVILSSDFGQVENGPIIPGFSIYIRRMLENGFTEKDIDTMVRNNPGELLS